MRIKFTDNLKLKKKINSLENEIEELKGVIKNELYNDFMSKLSNTTELSRLKSENKRLRNQVKGLKEIIKESK